MLDRERLVRYARSKQGYVWALITLSLAYGASWQKLCQIVKNKRKF